MKELSQQQIDYGLHFVECEKYTKLMSRNGLHLHLAHKGDDTSNFEMHQIAHAYTLGCIDSMPVAVES